MLKSYQQVRALWLGGRENLRKNRDAHEKRRSDQRSRRKIIKMITTKKCT